MHCHGDRYGNFNPAVSWTAGAGTITQLGVFTAFAIMVSPAVTITATSTQDSTKFGVVALPVTLASNVQPIAVDVGRTQNYVNGAFVTVTVVRESNRQSESEDMSRDASSSAVSAKWSGPLSSEDCPRVI